MANLNSQLFDLLVLRSLTLEKVKNGLSNDVALAYKSIFDDLINRINQEDYINEKNLKKIISELKDRINPELTLYTDLEELALTESAFIINATNAIVGAELFNKIPKDSTISKVASTSLFDGNNSLDTFKAFDSGLKTVVENNIKQAVYQGESIPEIRQRLITRAGIADNQARTLARTFTSTIVNNVRQEVYEENDDVIKGYIHISTFDTRTSDICLARSGKTWDIKKQPIGHSFPFRNPPLHHNCRSLLSPLTKTYREMGIDLDEVDDGMKASMDGQIPSSMTMEQWLRTKDVKVVEKVLGKGRAELFLDKKITLSQLVSQDGKTLSISELKELK